MTDDIRDALIDLVEGMVDQTGVLKRISQSVINQRSDLIALQYGFLAVAEQLAADGRLDVQQAAEQIVKMAKAVEPEKLRDVVRPRAVLLAARLDSLAPPEGPRPPRGSKPKLVE